MDTVLLTLPGRSSMLTFSFLVAMITLYAWDFCWGHITFVIYLWSLGMIYRKFILLGLERAALERAIMGERRLNLDLQQRIHLLEERVGNMQAYQWTQIALGPIAPVSPFSQRAFQTSWGTLTEMSLGDAQVVFEESLLQVSSPRLHDADPEVSLASRGRRVLNYFTEKLCRTTDVYIPHGLQDTGPLTKLCYVFGVVGQKVYQEIVPRDRYVPRRSPNNPSDAPSRGTAAANSSALNAEPEAEDAV